MSTTEVVDGQAVEEPHGVALEPVNQAAQATLFKTDDPVEVVEKASRVANAIKGVLTQQKLTARIQGKEHVLVEGWTTLGAMLGVMPVVAWTRKIEHGWEARVEAKTLDGRTIGAAEAECLRDESRWKQADDYAIRSMAQTRATSKALRGPLGFIVTLAGYSATPAEEMPAEDARTSNGAQAQQRRPERATARPAQATERIASAKQRGMINGRANDAGVDSTQLANILLVAAGQEPREFGGPDASQQFVNRNLDRLPARLVNDVLAGIEQYSAGADIPL